MRTVTCTEIVSMAHTVEITSMELNEIRPE